MRAFVTVALALAMLVLVQLAASGTAEAQFELETPRVSMVIDSDGQATVSWTFVDRAEGYTIATTDGVECISAGERSCVVSAGAGVCVSVKAVAGPGFDFSSRFSNWLCDSSDPFSIGGSYPTDARALGWLFGTGSLETTPECVLDLGLRPSRYFCVADEAALEDLVASMQAAGAPADRVFWIGSSDETPVVDYEPRLLDADLRLDRPAIEPQLFEAGDTDVTIRFRLRNPSGVDTAQAVGLEAVLDPGVENVRWPGTNCELFVDTLRCFFGDLEPGEIRSVLVTVDIAADADPNLMQLVALTSSGIVGENKSGRLHDGIDRSAGRFHRILMLPGFTGGLGCTTCGPSNSSNQPPGVAGTFSHPNLITFDARRYIFHGAGDYILSESTVDDFALHVRFSRMNSTTVSFNRAIAGTVGNSIISFGDDSTSMAWDDAIVRLDGVKITPAFDPIPLPGGATVRFINQMYQVDWLDGSILRVGRRVADPWTFYAGADRWETMQGLLGNADGVSSNDLLARDESAFNYNSMDLYTVFGASWLLDESTTMFTSELNPIDRLPIIPSAVITLADLPPADVAAADVLCREAGVQPGAGLAECVFDVALTGDPRWITGIDIVAPIVESSISVLAELGVLEDDTPAVVPGIITGAIDQPGGFDLYRLPLEAGNAVTLNAADVCTSLSTFEFALEAPSGYFVARSSGANCGQIGVFDLPETGEYVLRVYDTAGYTGQYAISVAGPTSDVVVYELDATATGYIGAGGEASHVFEVTEDGTAAYFDSQSCEGQQGYIFGPKGNTWELIDAGGAVVASADCGDDFSYTLDAGTWTLHYFSENERFGNYSFRVWPLPDAQTFDYVVDEVATGSLRTPTDSATYNFTVAADDTDMYFDRIACTDPNAEWQLIDPLGAVVADTGCHRDFVYTLDAGAWQLRIYALDDRFGDFTFRVWELPASQDFSYVIGDVAQGELTFPNDLNRYTFDVASSGTQLFFDVGTCYESWRLVDPAGNVVRDDSCFRDDFEGTFSAGTWTLEIYAPLDGFNAYDFQIWDVSSRGSRVVDYTLDDVETGSLLFPTDYVDHVITVGAGGTAAFFDSQFCAPGTDWQLINPDGAPLISLPCTTDFDFSMSAGQWSVRLISDSDAFGDYSFRVWELPPPDTTPIPYVLDDIGSGTFTHPVDSALHTFDVTAEGTEIFIDFDLCGGASKWQLLDPGGSVVVQDFCVLRGDRSSFSQTVGVGTWTLRLFSVGDNFGAYAFRIWDLMGAETRVYSASFDELVTGSFVRPADSEAHEFEVVESVEVFFDARSCISNSRWELIDPAGVTVHDDRFCVGNDFGSVLTPGTWTVRLYSEAANTGEYQFFARVLPEREVREFAYELDATTTGSLNYPTDAATYIFDIAADNTEVFFDSQDCVSSSRWRLTDPAGQQVFDRECRSSTSTANPDILGAGTWRLEMYSVGAYSGTFTFRVWDLAGQQSGSLFDYTLDESQSGSLSFPNDEVTYIFDVAENGTDVYFESEYCEQSSNRWRLVAPDGSTRFNTGCFRESAETLEAGTWTLRVYSDNARYGGFTFRVWDLSELGATTEAYTLDDVEFGSLGYPTASVSHTFDIASDDTDLFFDGQGCNSRNRWQIIDSTGLVITDLLCYQDIPVTLTAGAWTVRIYSTDAYFGDYAFRIWELPEPDDTPVAYVLDEVAFGLLTYPTDAASHVFDVVGDDIEVFFDGQSCDGGRWQLIDPAGTEARDLPCTVGFASTLTAGSWTVRVYSNTGDFGDYSFRVWDLPERENREFEYTLDEESSGSLLFPTDSETHVFDIAEDGTDVYFEGLICVPNIRWEILNSDGVSNGSGSCTGGRRTLDAGTWTLRVYSRTVDFGEYAFRLWDLPDDETLEYVFDTVVVDGITHPWGEDTWLFEVTDTEEAYFDILDCDGTVERWGWDLYDEFGDTYYYGTCLDDQPVTLNAGNWILLVYGWDDFMPDYSFRLWDLPEPMSFPYAVEDVATGSLSFPTDAQTHTFDVAADGTALDFDAQSCAPGNFWQLIDPGGGVIDDLDCSQDFSQTLSAGTWSLRIYSEDDVFGDYSFQVRGQ